MIINSGEKLSQQGKQILTANKGLCVWFEHDASVASLQNACSAAEVSPLPDGPLWAGHDAAPE